MKYNCRRFRPHISPSGRKRRRRPVLVDRYRYIKLVVSTISTLEDYKFLCGVRFIPEHQRFVYIQRKHDPIVRISIE